MGEDRWEKTYGRRQEGVDRGRRQEDRWVKTGRQVGEDRKTGERRQEDR